MISTSLHFPEKINDNNEYIENDDIKNFEPRIKILQFLKILVKNFQKQYTLGNRITIDETLLQFINRFDGVVGNNLKNSDNENRFKSINELLLNILINVYGLTTLVINHGDFYNDEFLGKSPFELFVQSSTKQPIIDYENNQRNFLEQILDIEIKLFELNNEYSKDPTKNKAKKIKKLEEKLNDKKSKFSTLPPESVKRKEYFENNDRILTKFDTYMDHFYNTNDIDAKERIKSIILCIYDEKIQNELKYSNAVVEDMNGTLTIMRNCFSHIGRIYIGQNRGLDTTLIMHDYDNNHEESGQVILSLGTMIDILDKPFEEKKQQINNNKNTLD